MSHPLIQVDAFTDKPYAGNPAAVCLLEGPVDEAWMQNIAREMNLSETAFLHPEGDGYRLRWFTPAVEVDLCGHATLASAHVLWQEGRLAQLEEARFQTRSGLLTCARNNGWIEMDFPATPVEGVGPPGALGEALGITPRYVGKSKYDYLVEVPSEEIVRAIEPDYALLATLDTRGVIVTSAFHGPDYDFISRFFAPGQGIDEDPVTGSAHCALGPFWGGRLKKEVLTGYQASARGGTVRIRLMDDRALICGKAVTVMKGALV
jgi:PhzF family phenazine biosynthesis protein